MRICVIIFDSSHIAVNNHVQYNFVGYRPDFGLADGVQA